MLQETLAWLQANWDTILEVGGAIWFAVSLIVSATPTQRDDEFLALIANRLSFLKPRNVPGLLSLPGKLEEPPTDPFGGER